MGSAAAYHLARRGRRVLGLEQFTPAHDRGSSHGRSRIIRQSYIEGPQYVPLLLRAYELWRELELQTGHELLRITGGLMIGRPESATVAGSLASAREHGLRHEILDAAELRRRYPITPDDAGRARRPGRRRLVSRRLHPRPPAMRRHPRRRSALPDAGERLAHRRRRR